MIDKLRAWITVQTWSLLSKPPGLKAKVARNDTGEALGVRADFKHPSGRIDSLALSLHEPSDASDAQVLRKLRGQITGWVDEVKAAHP